MVLALGLTLISAQAPAAISSHTAQNLTCDTIHRILREENQVLLRYPSDNNPNLFLFDRYVAEPRFCPNGEAGQMTRIRSRDRATCPVIKCESSARSQGR